MRLQDLLTMFGDELDEVARLNKLEDRTEAVEALRHEMYARKNLFGLRPFYKLPKDLDMDAFERYYLKVHDRKYML